MAILLCVEYFKDFKIFFKENMLIDHNVLEVYCMISFWTGTVNLIHKIFNTKCAIVFRWILIRFMEIRTRQTDGEIKITNNFQL